MVRFRIRLEESVFIDDMPINVGASGGYENE